MFGSVEAVIVARLRAWFLHLIYVSPFDQRLSGGLAKSMVTHMIARLKIVPDFCVFRTLSSK